jgi:replicative DNA helicase
MTDPVLLSDEEIARLVADADVEPDVPSFPEDRYRYIRPLTQAADDYISYIQNPEGRFMLGIGELDAKIRGFGRGELAFITGKPHEGKTQLLLNAVASQPDKRVLVFTFDEVAELVLAKLIGIRHGINGEQLEQRIKRGDSETIELVKRAADEDFANLIVIDQSMRLDQMADAVEEARDYFGADLDLVMIDYLDLMSGDVDVSGTVSKANKLKNWTKNADVPVACLHQASRGSGPRGQSAGMEAMRYGGDDAATFVIEVYRKRGDKSLDEWDRRRHENTVTANVVKNKRPPSHRGEVDLYLDPSTGLIRPLSDDDWGGISRTTNRAGLGDYMRDNGW